MLEKNKETIREANINDIPDLLKWLELLIRHTQRSSGDPYINNLKPGYEEAHQPFILDAIKSDKGKVYLFEDEGVKKGFIYGAVTTPFLAASSIEKIGQINFCWVDEAYRNQGVASALVRGIEAWFKALSIEYVDLHYMLGNTEAEVSWEKMGYAPYRVASRKKLE